MALTPDELKQMDAVSGLTSDDISQMDAVTGLGQKPKNENTIADTIFDVFLGRTRDVVNTVTGIPGVNRETVRNAAETDRLFSQSQDLIRQARAEKDPIKKQELLEQSRNLDSQASMISDEMEQKRQDYMFKAGITEDDMDRSNLEFATRRGAGMAGELFALAAPGAKELKALSGAAKTANIFQKMVASGIVGGVVGGTYGLTDPNIKGDITENLKEGTMSAAKAFVTAAVLAGAIEIGKEGLKFGGKVLKSITPKPKEIFRSAFGIQGKINARIKPEETAQELAEMGIFGDFDDLERVGGEVTGANGLLPKINRDALAKVKTPIRVDEALTAARNQAGAPTPAVLDSEKKKILSHISSIVRSGDKPGQAQALDVFDAIKALEDEGYRYINSSTALTPNIPNEQKGEIYLAAADELVAMIDKTQVDENVIQAFKSPEVIERLKKISPKLANKFVNAKSMSDLRAIQKPFVRLMQMIDITKNNQNTPWTGAMNKSNLLSLPVKAAEQVLNGPYIKTGIGVGLQKLQTASQPVSTLMSMLGGVASKIGDAAPLAGARMVSRADEMARNQ
jgi:hypothetical protein